MGMAVGWTEQETLDTSIPAIELAWEGRIEILRIAMGGGFGGVSPAPAEVAPTKPPTGRQIFDVLRLAATPPPT